MRWELFICVAAVAADEHLPAPRVMQRFDTSSNPLAVCNDGSPAVYYFDPAPGGSSASNVWIVQLQDGGWCWSKAICDARISAEPGSVSSVSFPSNRTAAPGSLLNAGSSLSYGQTNVVFVRYCSSDAYIGNRPADVPFLSTDPTANNIHFRGREIVRTVLQSLVNVHGMSTASPQTLILAGSSAGGRGVLHNLNHAKSDIQGYGWNAISLYGIIDSGLYLVQPTLDWTKSDLDVQVWV